jgi:cytochrome P450
LSEGEAKGSSQGLWAGETTAGLNGVVAGRRAVTKGAGYRHYEVHQRLRVHQATDKLNPMRLSAPEALTDPFPVFEVLRENYPAFRDWIGNAWWISRYDDVTSVFVDDANFESRPRAWFYDLDVLGRNLGAEPALEAAVERLTDQWAPVVAAEVVERFAGAGEADLAIDFAARFPVALLARVLGWPETDFERFAVLMRRFQRGGGGDPALRAAGAAAAVEFMAALDSLLAARRAAPRDDLLSLMAGLETGAAPPTGADVAATLLEIDHETLHGGLANLLMLLLIHPDQLRHVVETRRMVRFAWLETLRHSPPVLLARRFARHEVERFGTLLPEGALMICAAGAANRDPRTFADPDRFIVGRRDLCQREPRGQYRADGLASGVAFGLGPPSRRPALPEDGPRSRYALTRDTAITALNVLFDRIGAPRLAEGAAPAARRLGLWEMHACWSLPVKF